MEWQHILNSDSSSKLSFKLIGAMFKGSSKGHDGQGAQHVGTSQMHQQCPPGIVQNIIGKNGKCDSFIPARSIKSMAPPLAGVANHFSNTQAPNLCGQQNKQ